MNNIDTYIISVCTALLLGGIVCIIRPSGNLQKTIKIINALFVIIVCISPLVGFENLYDFEEFNIKNEFNVNTELQDYINNEIVTESEEQIVVTLGEILSARGINDYSVTFEVNDNYEISCVNIYTKQKSVGLKEYLESKFNIKVNILEE